MKPRIAVFASGEGTNFEALVLAAKAGRLQADVVGLISNRAKAGALRRAEQHKIPLQILAPKNFASRAEWDQAVLAQLTEWQADWIALAGFLLKIEAAVLRRFSGRIVNSHPSLLPKFGGAGMYGDFVHQAVVQARESESGVTIHLIDENYDEGRIVAQASVAVEPGDTATSLAARVKAREVQFYPTVLNDLVTGRITSR